MAVLLIGSTGNGKSTLGNFLLNPHEDHIFGKKQTFTTAQTTRPETQHVLGEKAKIKLANGTAVTWTIIDTPGLNESNEKDLQHMIQIIESVNEMQGVQACIIVIKFASKIDAQYKATLRYYSKLLPSLFERNVLVVLTEFATDARSEALRKKQGIDVDQIIWDTIHEVVDNTNLSYNPQVFLIDCLPYDDNERESHLKERDGLLDFIAKFRPTKPGSLKVAKTDKIKIEDTKKIRSYEGEITGYNKRLQQTNEKAKDALEKTQNKEQEITDKEKYLERLNSILEYFDSSDTVLANSWNLQKKWKLWPVRQTQSFHVKSKWPVCGVQQRTNGHCEWIDFKETQYEVSGKVKGEFFRGLYATVELETEKRLKYAHEIKTTKERIHEVEQHQRSLVEHLKEIQERYYDYIKDIELLKIFIQEKRELIKGLSSDYMSLEEAHQRLLALKED